MNNFQTNFYQSRHEHFLKHNHPHGDAIIERKRRRGKLKTREQALAFYDELKKGNKFSSSTTTSLNVTHNDCDWKIVSELLNNLMDFLDFYLNEERSKKECVMLSEIEKRKENMIQELIKSVDSLYGNIYHVKIEDFESDSIEDLNIYSKISHKNRVDQLLIILDHCKCVYNQYFIVNNDVQLYNYLNLSITYGNVYENVKYLIYQNSELKSKVLNYFICRECKTNYNNFKKYKQLKINILNTYIQSVINRLGVKKDYVNNYIIYLTQCVKYFQAFGHLKNINKYQQIMPKMIRTILTRNTHKFSHHCTLNYSEILNNIGQSYDLSEQVVSQSLFLDHSVHPMQIYKYIQTQNEIYLLDLDQFIQLLFEKLQKGKPLSQQKFYNYLIYKFGYYNNDLFIEKFNETQINLKQFITQQVSNIILSTQCFEHPTILKYLLSKLNNIETLLTKSDPNWQTQLTNLYQYLLSNAFKVSSQ